MPTPTPDPIETQILVAVEIIPYDSIQLYAVVDNLITSNQGNFAGWKSDPTIMALANKVILVFDDDLQIVAIAPKQGA